VIVADAEPLKIFVDTDAHLASAGTPKKVVDALRRHLRRHNLAGLIKADGSERTLLNLLRSHQGQYRLPQGLLSQLTETCRRHGIRYSVIDKRAMVSCAPLRPLHRLSEPQTMATRRLLLRDSAVFVASADSDLMAIAIEVVARRQQRTLYLAETDEEAIRARQIFTQVLDLSTTAISSLTDASDQARIVFASYGKAVKLPADRLRDSFGMVVLSALDKVAPVLLMRTARMIGARYMLGLAGSARRSDGLHEPLYLAFGGIGHQIALSQGTATKLTCRAQTTSFSYDYQGRAQYQALVAALALDPVRNKQIVADYLREAQAGRSCVILSERRDHLEQLLALTPPELHAEQLTSASRLTERRKVVSRFSRGETRILLATGQIANDAIVSPRARCLFLTFPFSYSRKLELLVRRLLQPSEGKDDAVVYDYNDERVPPLSRAFEKRAQILKRLQRQAEKDYARSSQLELGID
jgi:hypothetical protein